MLTHTHSKETTNMSDNSITSIISPWEQGLAESMMAISEHKNESVDMVDTCFLFLQLPNMSQRWGRHHSLELTYLVVWLTVLILRLDQTTECKLHEKVLCVSVIPRASSTIGALERKERKEGSTCTMCLFLIWSFPYSCFKRWQNKCLICNFKIEFFPFWSWRNV